MCKHRPDIRVHCRYSCCVKMLLTGKGDEMTSENMYRELPSCTMSFCPIPCIYRPVTLNAGEYSCLSVHLMKHVNQGHAALTNVMFLEKPVIILNAGGIYNWFEQKINTWIPKCIVFIICRKY